MLEYSKHIATSTVLLPPKSNDCSVDSARPVDLQVTFFRMRRHLLLATALGLLGMAPTTARAAPDPDSLVDSSGAKPDGANSPAPAPQPAPPDPALLERLDQLEREVAGLKAQAKTVPVAAPATRPVTPAVTPPEKAEPTGSADGFHFGSYGRVTLGSDHKGRPGRDGDIVARGSRLDESTYTELELRREDHWEKTGAHTRIVATLAITAPLFHYNGKFATSIGVRNLYIEERGLGLDRLSLWIGSRLYRGDDVYLLDFWPLDNLNTVGGGLAYRFLDDLVLRLHTGINQPSSPFFLQTAQRPRPLARLGATEVKINDRQKFISSARLTNTFKLGKSGGIKPVLYSEVHYTSSAQQEVDDRQFEDLPADSGFVVGAQLGVFTGKRSTHVNLVARYAQGLAAYGEFSAPTSLSPDRTSKGARELLFAVGGNYEKGPFGLLFGGYWRTFRNASQTLDADDLSEGIAIARPTVWFGDIAGISVEGSYQAQRRGVLIEDGQGTATPQFAQMGRFGVIPFVTPSGRGNYARPHLRLIYLMSVRDKGAKRLYARDDVYSLRGLDHYIGLSAEWWFGSTSYFRN